MLSREHVDLPGFGLVSAFGDVDAVQASGRSFQRMVDQLPNESVLAEIDQKVDIQQLENVLMDEGIQKFADPQKALISLIGEKRASLAA